MSGGRAHHTKVKDKPAGKCSHVPMRVVCAGALQEPFVKHVDMHISGAVFDTVSAEHFASAAESVAVACRKWPPLTSQQDIER